MTKRHTTITCIEIQVGYAHCRRHDVASVNRLSGSIAAAKPLEHDDAANARTTTACSMTCSMRETGAVRVDPEYPLCLPRLSPIKPTTHH